MLRKKVALAICFLVQNIFLLLFWSWRRQKTLKLNLHKKALHWLELLLSLAGNVCLYVMLSKTVVRKTFHNLLLLLNTFELVTHCNQTLRTFRISNLATHAGVPGVCIRSVLRTSVLWQQLRPGQAQHALCPRGGTRRHGENILEKKISIFKFDN